MRVRKWEGTKPRPTLDIASTSSSVQGVCLRPSKTLLRYRLYVAVIGTIRGYGDYFWVDVVEQMDAMLEQVNGFQNQAKKLPKALRELQAFHDCKKTIDDFLDELPLFQALANKAMRPRCVRCLSGVQSPSNVWVVFRFFFMCYFSPFLFILPLLSLSALLVFFRSK